jgi:Trk K+ transport system NAD-binding subunit
MRQNSRSDSHRAARNVLVIGGDHFGLAVAEYLTESAQSVTFVSETNPTDVADGVKPIHHELSSANDIRALASEIADVGLVVVIGSDSETLLLGYLVRRELDPCNVVAGISNPVNGSAFEDTGVDHIDLPRLLAEQICNRYE